MDALMIRKPLIADAAAIAALIRYYADRRIVLPRTHDQICERLRDFLVAEDGGAIVGCCALHIWSADLAEVRSLAVAESHWKRGIGRRMVERGMEEARAIGVSRVFALTYQPEFFERLGFARVPKERFPHKIWSECAHCPQFPNCGEIAVLRELVGVGS